MKDISLNKCLTYIEAQERSPKKAAKLELPLPSVTISREAGAGATSLATRLVAILEKRKVMRGAPWTVFDQNLVAKVLQDHSLPERIRQFMPEDVTPVVTGAVEEMLGLHPSSWTLHQHTVDTIFRLALLGNSVLIGRGANFITAQMPHVLHVRLVAPKELRIKRLCKERSLTPQDAEKMVRQMDAARRRYVKSHFNADISDPLGYDLVINTGRIDYDRAAGLIASALYPEEH